MTSGGRSKKMELSGREDNCRQVEQNVLRPRVLGDYRKYIKLKKVFGSREAQWEEVVIVSFKKQAVTGQIHDCFSLPGAKSVPLFDEQ